MMVDASIRPDVVLPGMNGYDVARRLRRLPGMDTTLLVAITGYGQEADVKRCMQAGGPQRTQTAAGQRREEAVVSCPS